MSTTLELNNVRNNATYIQLNVDDTGWNDFTTKAPTGETTSITIVDVQGNTPDKFNSLAVRFHKTDDPGGSGKGELQAKTANSSDGAVVVLGKASGTPQYDACLVLELDNQPVSTVLGFIDPTG